MPKITIVDYDPSWPDLFEQLRQRIWPSIQDVAATIEHVGSTAVKGLPAKPIIDMTIVVPDALAMETIIARIISISYAYRGDLGVTGREAFARPEGTPEHHLYACIAGNDALRNHLAVRDYLRNNPSAAEAYGALKKQLATRFADDIDGYVDGKTAFILEILTKASFSPDQINAIRTINSKPTVS